MSKIKSILPDKRKLLLGIFYKDLTEREEEIAFEIGFSGDQIMRFAEEYANQCMKIAIELASEEAFKWAEDNQSGEEISEIIIKLKSDQRLKP